MPTTLIPRTAGRTIPWGNRLGTSREIILEPIPPQQQTHRQGSAQLLWRLATTRIEADCPFSPYPGQDRIIVLLKGNGFELRHGSADAQAIDAPYDSIRFGGDWGTHCRLVDGPVEVLNVMWSRDEVACSVSRLTVGAEALVQRISKTSKALYVLDGKLSARLEGEPEISLQEGDTVRLDIVGARCINLRAWRAAAHLLFVEAATRLREPS